MLSEREWIIFHGAQVVTVVPDEVHSYWHHELDGDQLDKSGVWRVENSEWLRTFDARHLNRCAHFILDSKVVCEALLIGPAPFELEQAIALFPVLADAYFWKAFESKCVAILPAPLRITEK